MNTKPNTNLKENINTDTNAGITYVLASGSPRRIEMMHSHGYDPIICPADIDENIPLYHGMKETVMFLALKKAQSVLEMCKNGRVPLQANLELAKSSETSESPESLESTICDESKSIVIVVLVFRLSHDFVLVYDGVRADDYNAPRFIANDRFKRFRRFRRFG